MAFYESKGFISGAVLTLIGIILVILGIKFDTFVLKLFGGLLTGGGGILMGISIFMKDVRKSTKKSTRSTKKSSRGQTQNADLSHHPNRTQATTKKSRSQSSNKQTRMSQDEKVIDWLVDKTHRAIIPSQEFFVPDKKKFSDFYQTFKLDKKSIETGEPNYLIYGLNKDIPSLDWEKGDHSKYFIRGNYAITKNKKLKKVDKSLLSQIYNSANKMLRFEHTGRKQNGVTMALLDFDGDMLNLRDIVVN